MEEEICVHVMSRVVQKRYLMDDSGMEEMRQILRTQAEFAGFDVITFCFLKNHFHILLHLDPARAREDVTDEELVQRFRVLYGTKRSPSLGVDAETLAVVLKRNKERAQETRQRLKARMGDVSVFMREVKTRFTFWYNEAYQTVGTFWAERFRSVLVEPGSLALKAVAAYIDLNAVRAGLAEKPQSYRFCGLGQAADGRKHAQAAYGWLVRRRKGRGGKYDTSTKAYEGYVAYVERIVSRLQKEKAAAEAAVDKNEDSREMPVEEAPLADGYQAKGGAVGSKAWVDRLCGSDGLFGFLRKNKTQPFAVDPGIQLHAARRWRFTD